MKKKIAITLDEDVLKLVDNRRAFFGMGRSPFINMKLTKAFRRKKDGIADGI